MARRGRRFVLVDRGVLLPAAREAHVLRCPRRYSLHRVSPRRARAHERERTRDVRIRHFSRPPHGEVLRGDPGFHLRVVNIEPLTVNGMQAAHSRSPFTVYRSPLSVMSDKLTDFSERALESKTVYRGKLLHVLEDRVSMPDGRGAQREYIRHPG